MYLHHIPDPLRRRDRWCWMFFCQWYQESNFKSCVIAGSQYEYNTLPYSFISGLRHSLISLFADLFSKSQHVHSFETGLYWPEGRWKHIFSPRQRTLAFLIFTIHTHCHCLPTYPLKADLITKLRHVTSLERPSVARPLSQSTTPHARHQLVLVCPTLVQKMHGQQDRP